MVRCKSARTKECLAQLHVVAAPLQDEDVLELDVAALCEEIARKMRLLGGLAVEAPVEGLPLVDVRRRGAAVYDVAVRLVQASPLAVAALRAACAAIVEGPLMAVGGRKGTKHQQQQQQQAESAAIVVRVVKLTTAT
ncbi:hypothetical protein DQ04_05191030 [Trypanosoma grayi]|uniref:hypothetical protein n=1 Tax=Trypanosoma grayi TaxID=71804 RepID=UPI0004F41BDC|nr:hypothetical protein DQ04_05191030 [Trypanosoma grayi]KEG09457.1 hypothetical protein DQ04_05191030 [Trypanosoma grayi]